MADELDNHTLALLREMRGDNRALQEELRAGFSRMDARLERLESKVENIRNLLHAETTMNRCTVAGVETRPDEITRRLEALEAR